MYDQRDRKSAGTPWSISKGPMNKILPIYGFFFVFSVGVVLRLGPLPGAVSSPDHSPQVLANNGAILRAYLSRDEKWRFAVDVDGLPQHVSSGLLCLEDKRFYHHPGVDFFALSRAFGQNVSAKKIVSGGSTITMQVARLLVPRKRTYVAKLSEILRSIILETQLTKREILELYLTYAPFGANIEGLETAAQLYFSKPARLLSPAEAAFLFLLPQSPNRWEKKPLATLLELRNRSVRRFFDCGLISETELNSSLLVPLPQWRGKFRTRAAHFADGVRGVGRNVAMIGAIKKSTPDTLKTTMQTSREPKRKSQINAMNIQTIASPIKTTIDVTLQKLVEELVASREARLRQLGILNVGLLVVDNATGEIRAAVGNFDQARDGDAQSITSYLVPRSPGSLLKPFLYGFLIEAGEILPETLLEDVPFEVAGYAPKNYDGEFRGLVEARMALANSLNIPWVKKLEDIGTDPFVTFLMQSGLRSPQKRTDLGLSLVIGGLEINLFDLVMLYRSLADDGRMRPLVEQMSLAKMNQSAGWRWMHPGAAHFVREALKVRGRPDFAIDPQFLSHPSIRWKTGTSQGNHDAWAIGFDPNLTVGVWLGNLDRRPSPSLVGPEIAAPLLFDVIDRIRQTNRNQLSQIDWNPQRLEHVEVCAFSGFLAGPSCRHRKTVFGIRGLTLRHRCPFHHDILVDTKSGLRITRDCANEKMRVETKSALEFPADVASWLHQGFAGSELAPSFHPSCRERPVARGNGGLRIITPEDTTYVLHSGLAPTDRRGRWVSGQGAVNLGVKTESSSVTSEVVARLRKNARQPALLLPLRLKTVGSPEDFHCYLDGNLLGLHGADGITPSLTVAVGDHVLLCADDQGRSDRVRFSVEN